MSCAACQARAEKAVNALPGVESCAVSLLTNSMGVEGSAAPDEIIKAVEAAGYGASVKKAGSTSAKSNTYEESLKDTETPKLRKRLIASVILLIPLMYVSMGICFGTCRCPVFWKATMWPWEFMNFCFRVYSW